jgi:hypothetical protein
MKLAPTTCRARLGRRAWALLAVMSLSACGLMVLAGVMNWADQNAANTARNNEYFTTAYAAEAATEKVLASMSQQFQSFGFADVNNNMGTYVTTIPVAGDSTDGYWNNYLFSAGSTPNQIVVANTGSTNITMGAPFTGLTMVANTYEIVATARNTTTMYQIPATVGQQINFGYIPLFQFAIFYQDVMELEPASSMTVTGPVHGNSNMIVMPTEGITFESGVTASGQITIGSSSPTDPIVFDVPSLGSVDPLNLPVGVNSSGSASNVSQNVYGILQIPQPGQTPNVAAGQNLLYNQADMIIIINSDGSVTATSGAGINGQATTIPQSEWTNFLNVPGTNGAFNDQRDGLAVNPVVLDVSNLVTWSSNNTSLHPVLASLRGSGEADIQSIYVADLRGTTNESVTTCCTNVTTTTNYVVVTSTTEPTVPGTWIGTRTNNHNGTYTYTAVEPVSVTNWSYITNLAVTTQPGIVLSNGAVLPPEGLAVATPDPAYVVGNWNVQQSYAPNAPTDVGTANTAYTRPSAIFADAITVLSSAWNPANSTLPLSSRIATSDTVNSAFLTGNVPSNGDQYSGGVENLPRFLEDWANQTFTYNGSMVCMFPSQIANEPYQQPGAGGASSVFAPPTRNWAYDSNFSNPQLQPPLTPKVVTVQRSQWVLLAPYATNF